MTVEDYLKQVVETKKVVRCQECGSEQLKENEKRQFCTDCGWYQPKFVFPKRINPHGLHG